MSAATHHAAERPARPVAQREGFPKPAADATALVTGASSGIGAEFARALAQRGHALTLVARRADRLQALAAELSSVHGVHTDWISTDLADSEQREQLHAEVLARGRRVQVLVHSAGFGIYEPFLVSDQRRELEQIHLLIEAIVDLNARFLAPMARQGCGAIIHLASTAGFQPLPGNANYSASKAFVLAHSEALGEELRGTGVTVTAVCPGPVPTEFFEVAQPLLVYRIPRIFWCDAERVARDGMRAAERAALWVVPGRWWVRAFYTPYRSAPRKIAIPIARWMTVGELRRMRDGHTADPPATEGEAAHEPSASDGAATGGPAGEDSATRAPAVGHGTNGSSTADTEAAHEPLGAA